MANTEAAAMLSSGEVAHLAKVSTVTVRNWVRDGKLPCARTSTGMRLFARADVEAFLRERNCSRTGDGK